MSSTIKSTLKGAQAYNERAAESVWEGGLASVPGLLDDHPGLRNPPGSAEFATAVKGLQRAIFGRGASCDGMLGRGTWAEVLKRYHRVEAESAYWVVNDRRLPVQLEEPVQIINFDQAGGLDLHRFGHFSTRSTKPRMIVVHWGGLDPMQCHRVFSDPEREVSSHAGIGLSPSSQPTIYQYLDLNHKAWHAGKANGASVGIDICQQPGLKWADHYRRAGYDVAPMANTTGRGPSRVLSLDPRIAHATHQAIKTLCALYDIPMRCPRGADGMSESGDYYHGVLSDEAFSRFTGVIGHHHVIEKKWDCACWWSAVWEPSRTQV